MASSSWDDVIERSLPAMGGWRQRLQGAQLGGETELPAQSLLCERLLLMTGWGLISASTAQWLAAGAASDGLQQPDLLKLASLGSS
eukprot:8949380-Alexandrium_andersonii.AAC.1